MARNPRAAAPTVEDVFRLHSQGKRYEIYDHELVEMVPTGLEHGDIEFDVASVINAYAIPRRLGRASVGEVLCRLDPDTRFALAPDVVYVRAERRPQGEAKRGVFEGAPDLVVEILSAGDRIRDVGAKVARWLEYGVLVAVLVFPAERRIEVHRPGSVAALGGDEEFDLEPALPGFRARVSELFPTL